MHLLLRCGPYPGRSFLIVSLATTCIESLRTADTVPLVSEGAVKGESMKRSCFLALAALLFVWSAAAQRVSAASPDATDPQAQQTEPPPQNVPVVPPQGRQAPRGEDTGQQAQHVPVQGQQPSASDEHAVPANTPILAELAKAVDVKKAKQGEEVSARVLQDVLHEGAIVIPRGARIVGHVTVAQRVEKGSQQSELGIAWDRVETRRGEKFPLHAEIQAMASRPEFAESGPTTGAGMPSTDAGPMGTPPMGTPPMGPPIGPPGAGTAGTAGTASPGGMPTGGEPPEVGGVGTQTGTVTTQTSTPRGSTPVLTPRSTGAQGMPGVALSPQSDPAQGSLIRESQGNLRLESGTQLVLRVIGQ